MSRLLLCPKCNKFGSTKGGVRPHPLNGPPEMYCPDCAHVWTPRPESLVVTTEERPDPDRELQIARDRIKVLEAALEKETDVPMTQAELEQEM